MKRPPVNPVVLSLLMACALTTAVQAQSPATTATDPTTALPSLEALTQKLNNLFRSKASETIMTMKVSTRHFTRELKLQAWSIGEDQSVVIIRSPAREAGTATLRTPKGLWNYAPRADRMMRVPNSMLAGSWMGSHFSNEDVMRETDYRKDYNSTVAWDVRDGKRLIKLTMVPNKKTATVYSKMVHWIRPSDSLPVQTDYFDGSKVAKTMAFSGYKKLGGRTIPTRMEIRPTRKPKESTVVTYDTAKFDIPIDRSIFTQAGIRRLARRR